MSVSVYINMEMPTSCAFCKLKRRNGKKMICPLLNEEWDIRDPMSADFKLDNCPLVEIPPHGDLIDRDALENEAQKRLLMCDKNDNQFQKPYEIMRAIALAPTIIQASKEVNK